MEREGMGEGGGREGEGRRKGGEGGGLIEYLAGF